MSTILWVLLGFVLGVVVLGTYLVHRGRRILLRNLGMNEE